MHATLRVALRHLLVQDAAPGGHPLNVAGAEAAAIAEAVTVLHRASEHVGDRLDAAMRMPREPGEIVLGTIVAEVVEEEERVVVGGVAESKRAAQLDAGAFERRLRRNDTFDGSESTSLLLLQADLKVRLYRLPTTGHRLLLDVDLAGFPELD